MAKFNVWMDAPDNDWCFLSDSSNNTVKVNLINMSILDEDWTKWRTQFSDKQEALDAVTRFKAMKNYLETEIAKHNNNYVLVKDTATDEELDTLNTLCENSKSIYLRFVMNSENIF